MASEGLLGVEQGRLVERLCGEWEVRVAEADRGDAERALGEVYDQRGWERPKVVIWLDSPLAGAIAARTLLYGHRYLDGDPEAGKGWVGAATARLDGAFGTFDRQEPSEFEENQEYAARWRLPDVASAYKLGYDMEAPDLQAVFGRVGEPAWAVNGSVAVRFQQEALGPGNPELFAQVSAAAHARLLEGMRPVFPAERWEAVSGALRACADAPRPDHWKQWREVWAAARAPENHALLILEAVRRGDGGPLLRLAPAVGWWWALNEVALLTPPPVEVHTDGSGRLHSEDGPAVRYLDGFAQHCWRGQVVPPDLVDPGWSAADIAYGSDEALRGRAAEGLGSASYAATLRAADVVPDLRRCAVERLGWARFAAEAPLARVGEPVADPADPGCELALYDVPAAVFGRAARVVLRAGGGRSGTAVLVPTDASDPVAAASWLGDGAREPAQEPESLARIRRSERLREALAWLDFEMSHVSHVEHVEEVHLDGGARLEPIGGHGTGGTYFLCGDGPRRPVLYADSEGGYQVMGRDLTEALEFMVSADPDGGEPEKADEEAARELGVRLLSAEEYRARRRQAEAMAAALVPVMTAEGNAYEYRPTTWFRCG
ncbi:DUF6745 domain-containing protein [Actinomadura sp. 7K507]|uniref:DUF6745 domain-containing protein n=1 Tax=Actinomadura sp. 7K507 TaxID=2530365 RepID=UPI0014052346|nr:hypothetical protein [Actinomadura sp. 7K507]